MWINDLHNNLYSRNANQVNFRQHKADLVQLVQHALTEFVPVSSTTYSNNPIQLIDFFSGAGGTSLGFSALNHVIPAFKMLGGCDINKISASTYSHNFGTPLAHEDITNLAFNKEHLRSWLDSIGYEKTNQLL